MRAWLNRYGHFRYITTWRDRTRVETGQWFSHGGIFIKTGAEDPVADIYNKVKEGLYNNVCIVEKRRIKPGNVVA